MHYGRHIDNPYMPFGDQIYLYLSLTNKDLYEGGELIIKQWILKNLS